MAENPMITRDAILASLSRCLDPVAYVQALWEGGAIGHGRLDEWSDIDLYVLVDDGRVEESFVAIEGALASVAPVAIKYDIGKTPYQGVSQAFYRLKGTSEFLLLDVAVVTESAPDKFLEAEMHGVPTFLFCKRQDLTAPTLDRTGLRETIRGRVARLRLRMDLFHVFVQKELNRAHLIEAVDAYHVVVLGSLTELLRIQHKPVHHGFQTRYVYDELPAAVLERLEHLYLISSSEDLGRKYASARQWFDEVYDDIQNTGMDRLFPS